MMVRTRILAALTALILVFSATPALAYRSSHCGHGEAGFFNLTIFITHYTVEYSSGWRHYHRYEHTRWYGWEHLHWRTKVCPY